MQIVSRADSLHEMLDPVFCLSSGEFGQEVIKVNSVLLYLYIHVCLFQASE